MVKGVATSRQSARVNRPRLLFVSPRFLFPLDQGGKIRTAGLLRAMKGGAFEITLASPAPEDAAEHGAEIAAVSDRFRSWAHPRTGLAGRVAGIASSTPVSAAADRSAAGRRLIAEELAKRPDVVVFDFAHSGVLMPDALSAPSVMFTHNIETEILERHARVAQGFTQLIWRREVAKMRAFEEQTLKRFDTVVAVSQRDADGLAAQFGLGNVRLIDTGVDLDYYGFHPPLEQTDTVVFSGAMDSRSNIDGIAFLMEEVWPFVRLLRPEARMVVAGRNPPAQLIERAKQRGLDWHFTGSVEDIRPHVLSGSVSVIPLRVGSGTRLKAFESMALGRPVVSTPLGVEGLPVVPGKHFIAAAGAEAFAQAICTLLANAPLRARLAASARELLEGQFSWGHIGRQFEQICHDTMARASDAPADSYLRRA
jgi:glycosyltransferase involved in cell wall biosynthesis